MTIHEAHQRLVFQLYDIYDTRESANIADLVMEHITGWQKIDRLLNKQVPILQSKIELLEKYTIDLVAHKPVQYILNEAWFYKLKFFVNEHVLIPRPETEELVEWVVRNLEPGPGSKSLQLAVGSPTHNVTALDIGTGSGCIAIALKKQLQSLEIFACDVSKDALNVAQTNALTHKADIGFLHLNFLDNAEWEHLPFFDIVVSNPPYIPLKDKGSMYPNVVQYEPHVALFVEDSDPFIFYSAIADFAKVKLNPGGKIFAEIHEDLASDVQKLFEKHGFCNIELKKDMQGRDRLIKFTT